MPNPNRNCHEMPKLLQIYPRHSATLSRSTKYVIRLQQMSTKQYCFSGDEDDDDEEEVTRTTSERCETTSESPVPSQRYNTMNIFNAAAAAIR